MKTRTGYWNGGLLNPEPLSMEASSGIFSDCRETLEHTDVRMRQTLEKAGVTLVYGTPRLTGPHHLEINDETIEFQRLVMATGTEAAPPEGIEPDEMSLLTHRGVIGLTKPPETFVVIGGDVEGLEFASLFAEMGTRVTVLEMMPQIMAGMDDDLTEPVYRRLKETGVVLHSRTQVSGVKKTENGVQVDTADGRQFHGDKAMVAMARRPVVPEGLSSTGLSLEKGRLQVNDQCQTDVPHIYAIGDINGRLEMAHTALQQGLLLADHLAAGTPLSWEYGPLPRVLYTLPQNGGAGLQEKQLQQQGVAYQKAQVYWRETWRGAGQTDPEGFLKILVGHDGVILGIWMTGYEISEQVNLAGYLVSRKATAEEVKRHLWVHPTLGEALLQAVLQLPETE